ncbi:hypothetical protein GCG54_00015155 [Colletotrichum gloeosporioides]|uniref:LysM domain-containing protein n=1 Tax=Colletotrichum gloeosporioides TaxID=474922 RepID=A0A8H4FGW7_COLGL|nr:uncharacterized protein GCG54_00015155 [Colletotrichum gloeosporioides]KAF3801933.1 hypothetical protein GCG54_00015155 [Colletotrichum gloeosporioides]
MVSGYVWYGYNESCQTDTSSGRYCNDIIDEFAETETLDEMPDAELCSDCFTARVRMMQQSTYSFFNTVPWYQTALEAIQTRCSVQGSTDVPPPLIVVPTPDPFCVSDKYYTTQAGDTCNYIALANDVSSANVLYAATAAGATRGCSDLPTDLSICLPLTCETYLLKSTDDCFSASATAGIEDITLYNSWIDDGCDNLHEANATLGSVVCASPLGGTYVPGTATNTSGIPGGGAANYSSIAVNPSGGATVAPKTTTECGVWYVAQPDDTCAFITMTFSIGLSLFAKMNPSVDAKTSGRCSASIVPGYAYCMSPVFNPDAGSSNASYTTNSHGCWSNLDNSSQVLLGPLWTDEGLMTLDACAKTCFKDRYSLAGLKGADTCLCGDQVSINSVQLSESECAASQSQDISLYTLSDDTKLTFQFVDMGCFAKTALIAGSRPSAAWATNNTVSNCASFCLPVYPYFGVTNGDTCRCGTGVDAAATALDTDTNCNVGDSVAEAGGIAVFGFLDWF